MDAALRRTCLWRAVGLGQGPMQARPALQGATPAVRPGAPRGCRPTRRGVGDLTSTGCSPWRPWLGGAAQWIALLVCLGLLLLVVAAPAQAATDPGSAPPSVAFRCDGVPLTASLHGGAVDDPTIPNRNAGTLPGAFVQLQWQQAGQPIALQLPRTNNAGAPSFTDGKWWWSLEDPEHPRFRLRRGGGDIEDFACERA